MTRHQNKATPKQSTNVLHAYIHFTHATASLKDITTEISVTSLLLLLPQLSALLQVTPLWVLAVSLDWEHHRIQAATASVHQVLPTAFHMTSQVLHQSWHLDDCLNKSTK